VGRTARAGRGGTSITLVTQHDIKLVFSIEEYTGKKLDELKTDGNIQDKVLETAPKMNKIM
jgi:ATP-dependent RNA helicase DDX49/DBP8